MTPRRRPANVLYCESSADGTIGGSHYCLLSLVEHLDRAEFEPLVVFYERHALLPRFEAAARTIIHDPDEPARWGGTRGLAAQARRAVNLTKFLGTVAAHVVFLRRHRIDLVHLNNSITRHQDWMLAALLARVPCVVHERGINPVYTRLDRAYARRLGLIISMSGWIRNHMIDRGMPGDKIRVMYDGLDPARLRVSTPPESVRQAWNVRPDQRVVGMVGNVRAWKGQETVVRAVIEVVRKHPDLVCFFVGSTTPADEPYKARLLELVAEAGIEPNVRFTGYQRDVPDFMHAMEFVIHASIEPEPFGMVVLEAMAQKKAVIGSRAGGPVEMIVEGDTGFTVPPGDPQALASRMDDLLSNPERCRQMGESGYDRLVSQFTLTRYMDDIHATYRALLAREPVPSGIGLTASDPRAFVESG